MKTFILYVRVYRGDFCADAGIHCRVDANSADEAWNKQLKADAEELQRMGQYDRVMWQIMAEDDQNKPLKSGTVYKPRPIRMRFHPDGRGYTYE